MSEPQGHDLVGDDSEPKTSAADAKRAPSPGESIQAKNAPAAIKKIPSHDNTELVREVTVAMSRSGPLPEAAELARYDQIIPDGANRIMRMAESQQAHRLEIEKQVIASQQRQSERGQIFGLIIGVFGISAGGVVAYLGHDWVGGIIAGSTVVSLVIAFVVGKHGQKRSLIEKAPPSPPAGSSPRPKRDKR